MIQLPAVELIMCASSSGNIASDLLLCKLHAVSSPGALNSTSLNYSVIHHLWNLCLTLMLLYPERYFLVMLKYCAHFSGAACGDKHRVFDETCGSGLFCLGYKCLPQSSLAVLWYFTLQTANTWVL